MTDIRTHWAALALVGYDIPKDVRREVLAALEDFANHQGQMNIDGHNLADVAKRALALIAHLSIKVQVLKGGDA